MARVTFYTFKETTTGDIVLDRHITADQLSVYRDGNLLKDPDFVINGDGTAWFESSGSGQYRVYLNGDVQSEFYDGYIVDDDVISKTIIGDGLALNSDNKLRLSGSVMSQSAVINSLQSSVTNRPLSAGAGRTLFQAVNLLEPIDNTILFESDVVNDFTSATSTSQIQSAQSLRIDYSNTNYLTQSLSMNSALRRLDLQLDRIFNQTIQSPFSNYTFW